MFSSCHSVSNPEKSRKEQIPLVPASCNFNAGCNQCERRDHCRPIKNATNRTRKPEEASLHASSRRRRMDANTGQIVAAAPTSNDFDVASQVGPLPRCCMCGRVNRMNPDGVGVETV
jgi:hypothetical protein